MSLSSAIHNASFPECFVNLEDFKQGMSSLSVYNSKGQLVGVIKKFGKSWISQPARGSQLRIKISTISLVEWTNDTIMHVRLMYSTQRINI